MSSAAKATANRANAAHSTGPGDTSRTRFNGLAHGLTSKQAIIPGESQDQYEAFAAGLLHDLKAASPLESLLAERVIAAAWRLKRFIRVEAAFYTNRIEAQCKDNPGMDPDAALANLFSDPAEGARMRLFLRYQTTAQKEYDLAMRELRKVQAERASQNLERAYALHDAIDKPKHTAAPPVVAGVVGFASQDREQRRPHTPAAVQILGSGGLARATVE